MRKFLDEAKRLIRISSISTQGNEEFANYLVALLQEKGLKSSLKQVSHSSEAYSKRQFNVLGVLGDTLVERKIKRGFLLQSHLDTAPPGLLENWTETVGHPHQALVSGDRIIGLGAANAKLDFLCKLTAVQKFREKKLKMPVYLLGTCGSEIGMIGTRFMIQSVALNPQYTLIGAPTSLKLIHAHKSHQSISVKISYQSRERDARGFNRKVMITTTTSTGHSAFPFLNESAVQLLLQFIAKTTENGFDIQMTHLEGGAGSNQIPDHAQAQLFLTSQQFEDFKRFYRDMTRSMEREKNFRTEMGGIGDTGVRFLPEQVFPCALEIYYFFQELAASLANTNDETFNPPYSTLCESTVKHREGELVIGYDLRLLPQESIPKTIEKIQAAVAVMGTHYPTLNLSVSVDQNNLPLDVPPDEPFLGICKDALGQTGLNTNLHRSPVCTEAGLYWSKGYPVAVFGPGSLEGNSHSPNESCTIQELETAIAFYEKMIERICL